MTHSISTGETVRTLFLRREGPTPDGPQPLPVTFSGPLTGYHLCWHPSGSGTTVITNERGLSVGQMVHSGEQSLASLVLAVNSEVTQCLLWEDHGIYSSHDPSLPVSIVQMNRLREPLVTYALKCARVVEHRVGPWHNDDSSFTMERLVIRYSGFTRTDSPPVKQRDRSRASGSVEGPVGESGVTSFVDTEHWVGRSGKLNA